MLMACSRNRHLYIGTSTRRSGRAGVGQNCRRVRIPGHSGTDLLAAAERRRKSDRHRAWYITDPAKAPARDIWFAEPAKVFDNLYFVGGKLHSAWALTTKDGIILIDTIYPYNSEELVIGGMQKLGLDPKTIRFVSFLTPMAITSAALSAATRYGARIVMGGPDWEMVGKISQSLQNDGAQARHRRHRRHEDHAGRDDRNHLAHPWPYAGYDVLHFYRVRPRQPVNVAYSGGTAFNFVNNTPDPGIKNFQTYIDSQKHMASKAAETESHRAALEPLRVRQRLEQKPHARRPRQRSPSLRTRHRNGPTLFPSHAGLRTGGAAEAGTESGRISNAVAHWHAAGRGDRGNINGRPKTRPFFSTPKHLVETVVRECEEQAAAKFLKRFCVTIG